MIFGHQNDSPTPTDTLAFAGTVDDTATPNPLAVDPATGVSLPTAPDTLEHPEGHDEPDDPSQIQPTLPSDDTAVLSADAADELAADGNDDVFTPSGNDDLLKLKQQALEQLSPLVGHLDQTPEEKFRTTMMMIQAADNQSLIQSAYEAAQQITDEKVRAQALLDLINEINYFTHPNEPQA
ncbi:MAG: hypothetical protein WC498_03515 [Candidatus Saccharimonadales bacterium]